MGTALQAREARLRIIADNPITISVVRGQRTAVGIGLGETDTTLAPISVRIYQESVPAEVQVDTPAGGMETTNAWRLVADDTADLKTGGKIRDWFDAGELGKFEITAVYPQRVRGEIVGYGAALKRVGG